MFGFAIVGCGMIARFHARALAEVPGAKLLALVSRNPANARNLADSEKLACDIYTDLAPMLARKDIHAVIVTRPRRALAPACSCVPSSRRALPTPTLL